MKPTKFKSGKNGRDVPPVSVKICDLVQLLFDI